MIGDDAVRRLALALRVDAGELGNRFDQRTEQIDLVIVVRALQHGGHAFEAQSSIDRRPRQVEALAVGELLVRMNTRFQS